MELELDITELDIPRNKGNGRKEIPCDFELVRTLNSDDLELYADSGPARAVSNLKTLRTTHHAIASYMAVGMKNVEIAALTGYSQTTISLLKKDPLFQELLAEHTEKFTNKVFDFNEKLELLGFETLDALKDVIQKHNDSTEGENKLSPQFLLEFATRILDRVGHSPVKKSVNLTHAQTNITHHLGAEELETMKQGINRLREVNVLDQIHADEEKMEDREQQLSLSEGSSSS